ncbi:hypothetical protein [uncultured Mesotoga sp.]|uniref:hypothetical protein n=1 Tax=uncultured Mesotoga sp. TaxID=1184400 RepID=UPI000EF15232|nr:hypothetical protein [uncultured Mesotoga sp.]RLL86666.1 hypothetical protein Y696_11250 [Mesotoga sp. H07pep.5.4]
MPDLLLKVVWECAPGFKFRGVGPVTDFFVHNAIKTRYKRIRQACHTLKRPLSNSVAMRIVSENNVMATDNLARKFL